MKLIVFINKQNILLKGEMILIFIIQQNQRKHDLKNMYILVMYISLKIFCFSSG